ncbi:MAG: phosphatidate cytidylyltransferase [Pelagibacteraceae bacterium]|nr:phosphatidate cytidylyltransferase [Pelagibacteraceae bacterium]
MINEFQKRVLSSLILIPLCFFFLIKGSFLINFFLIICLLVSFYEWYMMSKKKSYHFFGYLFLTLSFYSAYLTRNIDEYGLLFLFVIIICISTDIGGYVFGKTFKGPKLTKISPQKTYSGLLGSYFLSIITISFFLSYSSLYIVLNTEYSLKFFIMVILISTISQLGDITISYFKRLSNIKDTGKIIPGHGGLLDRIDGMIFAFPFSYIIFISGFYK